MENISVITNHFVKNEDLNHHGTLYAGRTAEWFVEAGLMSAAEYIAAENIVCVKVHGMNFTKPVELGSTAKFVSKVVHSGRTSLVSNIKMFIGKEEILSGFITFVNVDGNGVGFPHGVTIEPKNDEERALREEAMNLPR